MPPSPSEKALNQFHRSLKWLYQMLMALALYTGAGTYLGSIRERIVEEPQNLVAVLLSVETLVFLSFSMALVRFLIGDNRYLDILYLDAYPAALRDSAHRFRGRRRFADVWLLLCHGFLFYFLGEFLDNPTLFLHFYALLMLFNVTWLCSHLLMHWLSREGLLLRERLGEVVPQRTLIIWATNNFLTAIAIVTLLHYSQLPQVELAGILVVLLNSVVDFRLAWRFYFPDLVSRSVVESRG